MTNRKKIIIIGSTVILITVVAVIFMIVSTRSPEPTDINPTQDTVTPSTPEEEEHTHQHSDATDSHGEPLPEATQQAIMQNATQAAEAYVTQNEDEQASTRTDRLSRFFAPTSPVLTAKPPIEDETYSTAQVTTVESSWYDLEKVGPIGVIVYLKVVVNTGFGNYEEYQSWVVELNQYEGAWLSNTITKSDLQYIQGVN